MLRKWWLVLPLVCLCPVRAAALDPHKRISQYAHNVWRVQDGFFTGIPWAVAQTSDGYVWLGTASGLLRFDGVRFVPFAPGHGWRSGSSIPHLLAARDGGLWIATADALSRWKNETLTSYPVMAGGVQSIVEDNNGDIWFGQTDETGAASLCQVVGTAIRCLNEADGMPALRMAAALTADARGNLWLGGQRTLVRWSPSSHTVYRPDKLATNFSTGFVGIVPKPDGSVWVGIARGPGLQQIIDDKWSPVKIGDFDGAAYSISSMMADREGVVWIGTADHGLFRFAGNHVEHYDATHGLSGNYVLNIHEDHEGNVWVTTNQGLDRFNDTPVVTFSKAEGLCSNEASAVIAAGDGGAWVGGSDGVTHFGRDSVSCLRGHGVGVLPGKQVTTLLEDAAGRLWVGVESELWTYDHGHFRRIARPDGHPMGFVTSMALDVAGDVWVTANRPPRTLTRIHDLVVQEEISDVQMPRKVAPDFTGGVWLGLL